MSLASATKMCNDCQRVLSLDQFHRESRENDGRRRHCKECISDRNRQFYRRNPERRKELTDQWRRANRERQRENDRRYYHANRETDRARKRLRAYGVTPEQFAELVARQHGTCAICGDAEPGGRGGWHIDHDHSSGAVRGLLCHRCNTALGLFRDDSSLLSAARDYLEADQCL